MLDTRGEIVPGFAGHLDVVLGGVVGGQPVVPRVRLPAPLRLSAPRRLPAPRRFPAPSRL